MQKRLQSKLWITSSLALHGVLAMFAMLLLACEAKSEVGSTCPNGICPHALSRDDDSCLVSSLSGAIQVHLPGPETVPDGDLHVLGGICLPKPIDRSVDGLTGMRVLYALPSTAPVQRCGDHAFLRPLPTELRAFADQFPGREFCELNQLSVAREDGGESIAAGDGFYYDDFSSDALTECLAPHHRIALTEAARPWGGVMVTWMLVRERAADGQPSAEVSCEALPGTAQVGTACLPSETIYTEDEVVLETRAAACGGGVCMAYRLFGSTDADCTEGCPASDAGTCGKAPQCASASEIEDRAYCTCRCDAPPGAADACDCPDRFSCVPIIAGGAPGVDGSYCVKNGTF